MICDKCMKKDVCTLQEHCRKMEEHFKGMEVDNSFTVTVLCKHRREETPQPKTFKGV